MRITVTSLSRWTLYAGLRPRAHARIHCKILRRTDTNCRKNRGKHAILTTIYFDLVFSKVIVSVSRHTGSNERVAFMCAGVAFAFMAECEAGLSGVPRVRSLPRR